MPAIRKARKAACVRPETSSQKTTGTRKTRPSVTKLGIFKGIVPSKTIAHFNTGSELVSRISGKRGKSPSDCAPAGLRAKSRLRPPVRRPASLVTPRTMGGIGHGTLDEVRESRPNWVRDARPRYHRGPRGRHVRYAAADGRKAGLGRRQGLAALFAHQDDLPVEQFPRQCGQVEAR